MKKTFQLFMALVLLLTVAESQLILAANPPSADNAELELRVLTDIAGSERGAKRMFRTIEKYRERLDRIDQRRARGMDHEEARKTGLTKAINMGMMAQALPVADASIVWALTLGLLDLEEYLAASETELDSVVDELVVLGNVFDHLPIDPGDFSVDDIRTMRGQRRKANQLYREGNYDAAYPLLLELAQRGFKDSQSRLAYILFTGTDRVIKSNLRALGWLGSAAYGDTEPQFRVLLKRYLKEVPDHVRSTVDSVIGSYQESFAHDEYQHCSTEHDFAFGIVKRTYCRFKLETIAEACEKGLGGGKCWAHAVNQ